MSISADTLLSELIQGGRIFERWNHNRIFGKSHKRIVLRRADGTEQVIQLSPVRALIHRGYLASILWSGNRHEYKLITKEQS